MKAAIWARMASSEGHAGASDSRITASRAAFIASTSDRALSTSFSASRLISSALSEQFFPGAFIAMTMYRPAISSSNLPEVGAGRVAAQTPVWLSKNVYLKLLNL